MFGMIALISDKVISQGVIEFKYFNYFSLVGKQYCEEFVGNFILKKNSLSTKDSKYIQKYFCRDIHSSVKNLETNNLIGLTDIKDSVNISTLVLVVEHRFIRQYSIKHLDMKPIELISKELVKEVVYGV